MNEERFHHRGGRSDRGESLDGADFADTDLRGADFTGASLRSASFSGAALGVPPRVGALLLGAALAISVAAGVFIGFAVHGTIGRFSADAWDEVAEGGTVAFVFVLLLVVVIWRGLDVAAIAVGAAYVVLVVVNIVANLVWEEVEWASVVRATLVVIFVVLAVAVGILGRVIGGSFGSWAIAVVALMGGLASGRADGGIVGIVVAFSLVFISKRALRGDERDRTIRNLVHRLVRRWGTRFVDADLTGADFTGARAGQCDFTGATVADVRWDPKHPPVLAASRPAPSPEAEDG